MLALGGMAREKDEIGFRLYYSDEDCTGLMLDTGNSYEVNVKQYKSRENNAY